MPRLLLTIAPLGYVRKVLVTTPGNSAAGGRRRRLFAKTMQPPSYFDEVALKCEGAACGGGRADRTTGMSAHFTKSLVAIIS